MEGRLGRIIEKFKRKPPEEPVSIVIYIPKEMNKSEYEDWKKETPLNERLRWGDRITASEINNPEVLEDLFTTEPKITVAQTTLPWDGIEDMEIYHTRTMNDAVHSRFSKSTKEQIEKEIENMRLFLAGKSKTVTES